MKTCKQCKTKFDVIRPLQMVCSIACARAYGHAQSEKRQLKQAKNEKRITNIRKQELKPRAKWLQELQALVNKFVRIRDRNEPCISCGRYHEGQYHAGHYRSVGACPALRFNELNIHKQCQPCNNHLSGNIVKYRQRLIEKIGLEQVEWLEKEHDPLKLTIDQIKEQIAIYKLKVKELNA